MLGARGPAFRFELLGKSKHELGPQGHHMCPGLIKAEIHKHVPTAGRNTAIFPASGRLLHLKPPINLYRLAANAISDCDVLGVFF
jgi:hypothetical protein